jgi:hypothetical protein
MSNCSNNTLVIGRPTKNAMASTQCSSACSDLGHVDPLNKNELGPRKNRDKVREQIRDYILHMMGAPAIKLECDEQNVDFAIDQALKIVEDYAPREFFSYYVFLTTPGKSVYEMPPDVGYVRNVFYKEQGTFGFQASDLDGAIPIEYFYPGGSYASIQGGLIDPIQPIWGRMGEWVLYKQYEQMYSRTSSNLGGWEWVGGYRNIKLYPIPYKSSQVIVHYMEKCKDWQEVTQAMQEGALTYLKEIVGRIRSKYPAPPGPGGGMQLDGQSLIQEAREDRQKWFEDLIYKFGDILPINLD